MQYCKCGTILDALHMGDIDSTICIICERKIIKSMFEEIDSSSSSLLLWENGIKTKMENNEV